MVEKSLKDKTVKGVGWSAADAFLSQGVTFLVGLLLARLLSPEEYGLIGIVTIFTSILLGFVDCGFSNSLIRKRDVNEDDYNTMFVINFASSLFLYALLYISAPFISLFFERPQLISLIRVTGVLIIIQSFSIVQITILKKELNFKTRTRSNITAAIISGIIGIVMAYIGFGVWSLVGQQVSRQLVFVICLWNLNKWRPHRSFNQNSFHYMWNFGWKILLSGILERIWNQLYQVVVGKFYNPSILGQYTRSKEYANLFSSNLTSIVQRVSYPVLSQVQDDKDRMINGYRRIIKTTMFITAIIMLYMGAVAEPMIYCLIGEKWHVAATFLPLICLSMSLYPLHAINLNMLQVQNRTDIYLCVEIIKKILSIGPILLGIFVDVYWMLIGSIVFGFFSFFLNSYYTGQSLGYSSWKQLKDVAPSYGVAFIIALSVYFIKYLPYSYWVVFPIQLLIGIIVFFLTNEFLRLSEYIELKKIAVSFISKLTNK